AMIRYKKAQFSQPAGLSACILRLSENFTDRRQYPDGQHFRAPLTLERVAPPWKSIVLNSHHSNLTSLEEAQTTRKRAPTSSSRTMLSRCHKYLQSLKRCDSVTAFSTSICVRSLRPPAFS